MIIYSTKQLSGILSVSENTVRNFKYKDIVDWCKIGNNLAYFVSDEKIKELKKPEK